MRRSGKIQDTQAFVRAVLIMAALVTILSGIMIHWNPDPASAATKNDYGLFWYGKGKDDLKYYQADIEPYNTESPESMQLG